MSSTILLSKNIFKVIELNFLGYIKNTQKTIIVHIVSVLTNVLGNVKL